jgi:hypothetical protein
MKNLMFTLFIASVYCVIIPIYGQQKRPQSVADKQHSTNASLPSSTTIKQNEALQEDNGTADHPKSYLSRLFAPENLTNIGLLIAGLAGICVAVRTLKAISRQADQMERQTSILVDYNKATREAADAALLNANILMESQRPKITAVGKRTNQDMFDSEYPRLQVSLNNKGTTPAYDCTYETWVEVLPSPFEDFTSAAKYFKSPNAFVLYPNSQDAVINIPLSLTSGDKEDITSIRKLLCIRIRVFYRDFKPDRFVNFGYSVQYGGFGILPKYNDCN